jgi:hypothetical protein
MLADVDADLAMAPCSRVAPTTVSLSGRLDVQLVTVPRLAVSGSALQWLDGAQ